jgi:hypothetical protein
VIKFTADSSSAQAVLNGLPRALSESIRKKAIRAALQPYVKTLRQKWQSSPYRGKAPHRKAIAAATQLSSPKRIGSGDTATIRAALGVQYGRKGGAKARGRQRIYHLLEQGFKHVGSGRSIPGANRSLAWSHANLSRAMQDVADQIIIQARKALGDKNVRN